MHIKVLNMTTCFAMHMMTCPVLVFKTPEVLHPFLVMARPDGRHLRVTTSPLQRHPSDLDRNWFLYASFLALATEHV